MSTGLFKKLDFDQILPIWEKYLWPKRISKIEKNSAMLLSNTSEKIYDMSNMNFTPTFFAYCVNGNDIAGVNSGHYCGDGSYRSRGLYVFKKYREMGIGTELLLATIAQAKNEGAIGIWSYPRESSWKTYAKAGFKLYSDFIDDSEGNKNAYCLIRF